jgi:preprotein translocase SecE subunit
MHKINAYFKGVGQEARRVRWPNRKKLWSAVGTVCIITIVSALFIYFEDFLVAQMMKGFQAVYPSSANSSGSTQNSITPAAVMDLLGYVFRNILGVIK